MTSTGTSHFFDMTSCLAYYKKLGYDAREVKEMVKKGEISIGRPKLKEGETLCLDKDNRYIIWSR